MSEPIGEGSGSLVFDLLVFCFSFTGFFNQPSSCAIVSNLDNSIICFFGHAVILTSEPWLLGQYWMAFVIIGGDAFPSDQLLDITFL